MKKILFVILTVFIFFSCENDDLASKINESNDLYVFRGIEYSLEDGDSLAIIKLNQEPALIENNDSLPVFYVEPPHIDLYDSVSFCFYPDQYLPYILRSNEALAIAIPEDIVDNEIKLSSEEWKYSEEKMVYLKESDKTGSQKVEIPPCCKLISSKLREELVVTYIATFVGMVTKNVVELKGKLKRECIKQDKLKIELATSN